MDTRAARFPALRIVQTVRVNNVAAVSRTQDGWECISCKYSTKLVAKQTPAGALQLRCVRPF